MKLVVHTQIYQWKDTRQKGVLLLHNAIYMKFKNRPSSSMRREVKIVVISGSEITLVQT